MALQISLLAVLMAILFVLMFLGVPISIALGISTTVCLMFFTDMDLCFIGQNIYAALDSYALLAVPFFILASNIMASAGVAGRLLRSCHRRGYGRARHGCGPVLRHICRYIRIKCCNRGFHRYHRAAGHDQRGV